MTESLETLKPLEELTNPDFRNTVWSYHNPTTGESRQRDVTDLHRIAGKAQLSKVVPAHIRSQFATAQNLTVYAWFCYPFHMAAQLHALSTLEFALRDVLQLEDDRCGLKILMDEAIKQGRVTDAGFVLRTPPEPENGRFAAMVLKRRADGQKGYELEYFATWTETLPHFLPGWRNNLAHGSSTLWEDASLLMLCADLINQLYLEPGRGGPARTRPV